jgi:hypothetical protein
LKPQHFLLLLTIPTSLWLPTCVRAGEPSKATAVEANPLAKMLIEAKKNLERIQDEVRDYSCLVVRRERIDGKLGNFEYMQAKVRHPHVDAEGQEVPFSIYIKFLAPDSVKGREVLFVSGKFDNKMLVRKGGRSMSYLKTTIAPDSRIAMKENRYPLTEFGVKNLLSRLIEEAEVEMAASKETKIVFYENAKVNDRICTGIQLEHLNQEDSDKFHIAKVYVDNELKMPVHYEAFAWSPIGGKPLLLEQYT